jgi:D-serine deaminase-like pyridoxal phosphate-dependent protein
VLGREGGVSPPHSQAENAKEYVLLERDARTLDTPALLVDLPAMERNLATMAEFFRNRPAKLRPHFKNFRVLTLADRLIAAGAIGITCARLWQAEALVQHGIRSVLIANEIAGERMIRKFVELSRAAPIIVAVDDPRVVDEMARIAGSDRELLNVVVDIDLGLKRCGVPLGDVTLGLARHVLNRGLKLRGLMGYEGHLQNLPPGLDKERAVVGAMKILAEARKLLEGAGIPVEIVTCGGTGDFAVAGAYPGITEIQAGSYLLMGTAYVPAAPQFVPGLTVIATVISKPTGSRLVADAGSKAISGERGMPSVKRWPRFQVRALHAEHALIETGGADAPIEVGDTVELLVPYQDGTVNLHRQMFGVRDGKIEEVFTIEHAPQAA